MYANPLKPLAAALLLTMFLFGTCAFSNAQQHVIANKDNTHPEIDNALAKPAFVTRFSAEKFIGYNEIQWTALREEETRRYIVEFSTNGRDYQTAGEVMVNLTGRYSLKHYTQDDRAGLYRIRIEQLSGKFFNSDAFLLNGEVVTPVSYYPTILTTQQFNLNASLPVERLEVFASNGSQVYVKDLNGLFGHIPLVLPPLGKGVYFVNFYGAGWKSSGKIIIP